MQEKLVYCCTCLENLQEFWDVHVFLLLGKLIPFLSQHEILYGSERTRILEVNAIYNFILSDS
jgi:hypothetical protein